MVVLWSVDDADGPVNGANAQRPSFFFQNTSIRAKLFQKNQGISKGIDKLISIKTQTNIYIYIQNKTRN